MRTQEDLRQAIESVEESTVDPKRMLARIHSGSATRKTAQRHRRAGWSVAAATALIAVMAVVVPSLGDEEPEDDQVATPQPTAQELPRTEMAFSVGELPAPYAVGYAGSQPGLQFLEISPPLTASGASGPEQPEAIRIELFDPVLSGLPAPTPSRESILVDSAYEGPLAMHVTEEASSGVSDVSWLRLAVQTDSGLWLVVLADSEVPGVPQVVLDIAAQIDLGTPQPFSFPFQLGLVPDGFEVVGANGPVSDDGTLEGRLEFGVAAGDATAGPTLTISASEFFGVPDGITPNTTVGPYQAERVDRFGASCLNLFGVDGFMISLEIRPMDQELIDEAQLLRIAESIVVIPGARDDNTVWTTGPLG